MPASTPARRKEIADHAIATRWSDKHNNVTIKPRNRLMQSNGQSPKAAHSTKLIAHDSGLTRIQLAAIDLIMARTADDTIPSMAAQLSIHRSTLDAWLKLDNFRLELRRRTDQLFEEWRPAVAEALVKGSIAVGERGWTEAQKIFWQRLGELIERTESTVSGTINHNMSLLPIERLPLTLKKMIAACLDGWVMSEELEGMIEGELPMLQVQVESNKTK